MGNDKTIVEIGVASLKGALHPFKHSRQFAADQVNQAEFISSLRRAVTQIESLVSKPQGELIELIDLVKYSDPNGVSESASIEAEILEAAASAVDFATVNDSLDGVDLGKLIGLLRRRNAICKELKRGW